MKIQGTPLDDYVQTPDENYSFSLARIFHKEGSCCEDVRTSLDCVTANDLILNVLGARFALRPLASHSCPTAPRLASGRRSDFWDRL